MYNNQRDSLFGNMLIVQAYRPEFNAHHSKSWAWWHTLGIPAWEDRNRQISGASRQSSLTYLVNSSLLETLVPPKGEQYLQSKSEGRPVVFTFFCTSTHM